MKAKPTEKPSAPVCLELRGVKVVRDGVRILHGVDWCVREGERWAVLGGNGSGKTTMLSALTGYLMPTEGEIELLGQIYGESDWRALRERLGIVSSSLRQMMADEEPALTTVVSGKYGVIDLWGPPEKADTKRGRQILRHLECGHLAGRPWSVLSQGERQRILIGRALMARPALLILDEPCAGLDPVAREHFLQFLERLNEQRQAPTVILVTHHVEEITPMFTHALLLREGQVVASGEVKKVCTAKNLSAAFGERVGLRHREGRYQLSIPARPKVWL